MRALLGKIEKSLTKLENALVVILLLGILLVAVGQIVLRNGFSTSLSWSDATLKMAVLWLTLLGSVLAARENRHLSIDVFSKFLPTPLKRGLDIIVQTFSAFICVLLAYYSFQFVGLTIEFDDQFLNRYPLWWFQAILPVGFALMSLRFCLNVFVPQTADDYLVEDIEVTDRENAE